MDASSSGGMSSAARTKWTTFGVTVSTVRRIRFRSVESERATMVTSASSDTIVQAVAHRRRPKSEIPRLERRQRCLEREHSPPMHLRELSRHRSGPARDEYRTRGAPVAGSGASLPPADQRGSARPTAPGDARDPVGHGAPEPDRHDRGLAPEGRTLRRRRPGPCYSAALTTAARMPVHPALFTVTVMGALVALPPPASAATLWSV
jgi:hypothetical protein